MRKNLELLMLNRDKEYQTTVLNADDIVMIDAGNWDAAYLQFLNEANGGFFFSRALQMYSLGISNPFNNIVTVNEILQRAYPDILEDEFFFAQEIFGNQFGFSKQGIIFFNIETGEKEVLGADFNEWLSIVINDIDYYTGINIINEWEVNHPQLNYNERLCPTIPFAMGGAYEIENLYSSCFPDFVLNNSNIAKQIYHLPDGTHVRINPVE